MKAKDMAKAFLAILFGAIGTASSAATFYVDADAGDDENNSGALANDAFRTITHALSLATANDVVELAAGVYSPDTGEAFPLLVPAFATVRGAGIFDTVVSVKSNNSAFVLDAADGAVVERLTVQDVSVPGSGSNDDVMAFWFNNTESALVRDVCIRRSSNTRANGHIFRIDLSSPIIRNCLVVGNAAGKLVEVSRSASAPSFENCTFYGNSTDAWGGGVNGGVKLNVGKTTFIDCVFWRNNADIVTNGAPSDVVSATNCVIESGAFAGENNNIAADPQFFGGYFAPQIAAGQSADGATVDAGSRTVAEAGLVGYTTRADGVADTGIVDIGFHYPPGTVIGGEIFVAMESGGGDDELGDGSAGAPFRTITKALRGAPHGATVRVAPGVYQSGETFPIAPPDGVSVVGADVLRTKIAVNDGYSKRVVELFGGGSMRFEGFTVAGAISAEHSFGIYVYAAGADVRDCIVTRNHGFRNNSGGVFCGESVATFANMLISANSGGEDYQSYGGGISFSSCIVMANNLTVVGNTGNNGTGGDGISAERVDSRSRISDSIAFGNGRFDAPGWSAENLQNCLIGDGAFNGTNGCFAADPLLTRGYFLSKISAGDAEDSPCLDAGSATAAERGFSAYSATRDGAADSGMADLGFHLPAGEGAGADLFVDIVNGDNGNDGLSPQGALQHISAALPLASFGSIIHVATGVYSRATGDFPPFDLPDGVGIIGAGWETTTIMGGVGYSGFELNGTGNSIIEGFTLRGARDGDRTAGILLIRARALIQNCRITDNFANWTAGGIHIENPSAPIIRNCVIDRNIAWKWEISGGGISLESGRAIIENCTIVSNNSVNDLNEIVDCQNQGGGGIAMRTGSWTFSAPEIRNCIIDGNSSTDLYGIEQAWIRNCLIGDGSFDGVNANISAAPIFNDAANADYSIMQDSPGVDAGVNMPWMLGATDIAGNPRIENGRVDMGAFENTRVLRTMIIVK